MKWEFFEKLVNVLHFGETNYQTEKEIREEHPEVDTLLAKNDALENQKKRFKQACEKTILDEYKNLRRAHRDFMNSYETTHQQIVSKNNQIQ